MKKFLTKTIAFVARPFLGTGISKKLPFLHKLFLKIYPNIQTSTNQTYQIPLNSTLTVTPQNTGIGTFLSIKGEYEPAETKLFLEKVQEGNTVFDIGANIGYYTVLASKKVGPKGKVYSVEPLNSAVKLLKQNILENKLSNVSLLHTATGHKKTTISISFEDETQKTPVTTVDNIVQENGVKTIDFMVMDIEGGEVNALKGATNTLKTGKIHKLLIEVNPEVLNSFSTSWAELAAFLRNYFHIYLLQKDGTPDSHEASDDDISKVLSKLTYTSLYCERKV